MMVDPERTAHHAEHDGHSFHFCSARCHDKFVAAPEQYLKPEAKPVAPEQAGQASPQKGVIYTCPMHPEIRQEGPGNCPICGMALEPVGASVEEGPNPELVDMTRRFWIGLVLSVPLLVLEMGSHIPALGVHDLVPPRISIWIQLFLAAYFGGKHPAGTAESARAER
jgi:Cu+-exporting ATPase